LDRSDRACAFLKALADPTVARRRLSEHEARAIELHQLGTDAAAKLREAADAVLAIQQMAEAETAEIDMRAVPEQREATA
jgi:hypothetical protein